MNSKDYKPYLYTLYSSPNPVNINEFSRLASSIFVPEDSVESRIEAFIPPNYQGPPSESHASSSHAPPVTVPKKAGKEKDNDFDASNKDLSLDSPPPYSTVSTTGTGSTPSQLLRVENADQLRLHANRSKSFRAYFIRQRSNHSALSISRQLFTELLKSCRAPHQLYEYVLYMGSGQHGEVEVAPPPLRDAQPLRNVLVKGTTSYTIYSIRFPDKVADANVNEPSAGWSLRQSIVFAQLDRVYQLSSWIFVNVSQSVQDRLQTLWASCKDPGIVDPIHFHLLIYGTVIAEWRAYLVALNMELEQHNARLSGLSDEGLLGMADVAERQKLLKLEHKILSAKTAIDTALADLAHLQTVAGKALAETKDQFSQPESLEIRRAFDETFRELEVLSVRLQHLDSRLQSVNRFMSHLVELKNGLALQELLKVSRK